MTDETARRIVEDEADQARAAAIADASEPELIPDALYDRSKFIGSSNVAAIMGSGASYGGERQTAYEVWRAKMGEIDELSDADRRFLERRKRWEPVVVRHLQEEFEAKIVGVNRRYRDPEVPYFASEIDFEWEVDAETAAQLGLPEDLVGSVQNGEIKTVYPLAFSERSGWGEPWTDEFPIHYYAQVQFGLGVTRRQVAVVVALIGVDKLVFYVCRRDERDVAIARATCQQFWTENVLKRIPPDPQSLSDLARRFAVPTAGASFAAEETIGSKALRLRAIIAQIDAWELEREALEFDVKNAMREAEELLVDGRKIITWKQQNWSRFDVESVKEKEKKLYRQYLLSGKHRVFKTLRST